MKAKELYIEQMNQFCDSNCNISAEDILAKAKQTQEIAKKDNNAAPTTTTKKVKAKKTIFRFSPAVAACLAVFLLTGTTILAFSGKIGNILGNAGSTVAAFDDQKMKFFFLNVLQDEVTAELVGQGYLHEIHEVGEDDNFSIEILAATGDIEHAKLAVDVTIKDEKIAAANDRIYLIGYWSRPGESPFNDDGSCCVTGGYGVKDETVDNLYHVLLDISPQTEETTYYFTTVITNLEADEHEELWVYDVLSDLEKDPRWKWHSLDIKLTITVPDEAYGYIANRRYRDIVYHGKTYDYYLDSVEYGYYDMKLNFHFEYESDFVPGSSEGEDAYESFMATEFYSMLQDAVLIIDGKEYKYQSNYLPVANCYISEDPNVADRCDLFIYFPASDYFEANSIQLRIGEETYDLKESE